MSQPYVGQELELFALALNWKAYLRDQIAPFVRGAVLEVGAGIGGTTRALASMACTSWLCLEPDPAQAAEIWAHRARGELPRALGIVVGKVDVLAERSFDTVLYMDVLEHIEGDVAELERARDRLRPGGHLIVVSPAHPWLYSPFDEAIGHHRRYTRRTLCSIAPRGVHLERCVYLDTVGLLASAANRLLLKSDLPTPAQIRFWDRVLVRASRLVDPLLRGAVGKSVLAVWSRRGEEPPRGAP